MREFVVGTGGAFFTGGLESRKAEQRGAPEQHLRRAEADASPDELRLAVRPGGGQDVHRFRQRRVSSADRAAAAAASSSAAGSDGAEHLEADGLARAVPGRSEAARDGAGHRESDALAEALQGRLEGRPGREGGNDVPLRALGGRHRHRHPAAQVGRAEGQGKCRSRTRANRRRAACIRYRRVGRFRQAGVAGSNTRWFSGWLGRRKLNPGTFRAGFVAADAAGNRSPSKTVAFTIVGRRHRPGSR